MQPENQHNSAAGESVNSIDSQPSWTSELLHSLAYSAIQKPYDGISQAVNHFGGNLSELKLVEPLETREVGSPNWLAQQLGSGLVTLASILAIQKGLKLGASFLGMGTASSLTVAESAAAGKVSLGTLSFAGGIYEGLANKTETDFWRERLTNAGVGAFSMYALGRTQMGLQK